MRRLGSVAIATVVLVGALAMPALAWVSGTGLTHAGATLGFTAHKDLTGHLRYVGHTRPFSASCDGYTSYKRLKAPKGVHRVRVTATCTRDNGKRAFLKAVFVDRGEPSTHDVARIYWKRRAGTPWSKAAVKDRGRISAGNIQIG